MRNIQLKGINALNIHKTPLIRVPINNRNLALDLIKFRKYCDMFGIALVAEVTKAISSEDMPKYADTNDINGVTKLFAKLDKITKILRYFKCNHYIY